MYATPLHIIRRRGVQIVRSDSEQLRARIVRQISARTRHAVETLNSRTGQLEQAIVLANALQSAGIRAEANGAYQHDAVLLYVFCYPRSPQQIDDALTRLDLRITSQHPGRSDYELRLQGYEIPLYVQIGTTDPQ